MKFDIERQTFLEALQPVVGVVERRQTMPVLSNFLLQTDNGNLAVTGTDLELELLAAAEANVHEAGRAAVPARKLFDICRGLPDEAHISCELAEQKLHIRSGRSRFTLSTLPATDFPVVEDIGETSKINIEKQTLERLIHKTQFAMAHQDVRYYLNGLLLVLRPDRLRAVATDGHRLALCDAPQSIDSDQEQQLIIPRKAVAELQKLLASNAETVPLELGSNHLRAQIDDVRLTTKLIDGRFPDYERVIPEEGSKLLSGNRQAVRQALARTAILSNEKFRGVRLELSTERLRLQAQNPDHEEAQEDLDATYEGAPIDIGFNVNYLLDALAVLDGEEFTLSLSSPDSSGLIRDGSDPHCRYVVMPMRL